MCRSATRPSAVGSVGHAFLDYLTESDRAFQDEVMAPDGRVWVPVWSARYTHDRPRLGISVRHCDASFRPPGIGKWRLAINFTLSDG
jgi:hypothetical protein